MLTVETLIIQRLGRLDPGLLAFVFQNLLLRHFSFRDSPGNRFHFPHIFGPFDLCTLFYFPGEREWSGKNKIHHIFVSRISAQKAKTGKCHTKSKAQAHI
jgi:hypothetical protein